MSGFSRDKKRKILENIANSTLYMALTTIPVTSLDDGSSIVEPTILEYDTYTRASVDNTYWQNILQTDDEFVLENSLPIIFVSSTINTQTLLTGYAFCDAPINGNVIFFGNYAAEYSGVDITPTFPPSSIRLKVT